MTLRTVRVPAEYEALFEQAEAVVSAYFEERSDEPEHGTIEISEERYILVRAASLSVEFHAVMAELFGEGHEEGAQTFAANLLFDLAHAVGRSDAHAFHQKMGLEDPIARLSAGPVHFAHAGWAFVDIFPESSPTPDEDFFLVYDHPYSFEADAWVRSGKTRATTACDMNAGYSSGWCEASFGVRLVASEVLCRARGDECCRFVMAHPDRIEAQFARYARGASYRKGSVPPVPNLFARKRLEEELRKHRDELEIRVRERTQELETSYERLRHEVAQRETVEKRLLQKHKLEAIGRLAGGIAHDFNNLMGVIMGHSSMIQSRLPKDDPLREQAKEITQACARAANLTNQLLAFSRSQRLAREPMDLNQTVTELGSMLDRLLGEGVSLALELAPDVPLIAADRGQVEQVIVNLIVNARDAMPDGGTVRVLTRRAAPGRSEAPVEGVPDGVYGELRVTDEGSGMDEETQRLVFDPFFTTKEEGKGTGLGLSTVYGIVQQTRGAILLDSAPGHGTTFIVYFPAADGEVPPSGATGDSPEGEELSLPR